MRHYVLILMHGSISAPAHNWVDVHFAKRQFTLWIYWGGLCSLLSGLMVDALEPAEYSIGHMTACQSHDCVLVT